MPLRVLIDTNVWRYLADAGAGERLRAVARRHGVAIQVAPSTVYETLAMPEKDRALRDKILRLQTAPAWERLMPEAYSESMEVLQEVRRLHPGWLKANPDLEVFNRFERDWTRRIPLGTGWNGLGFWNRVRQLPSEMAEAVRNPLLDHARKESKEVADWTKQQRSKPLRLKEMRARLPGQLAKSSVDAWRWPALHSFAAHIQQQGNPYRDWLCPFFIIDPAEIGPDAWTMFWIYESDVLSVPRQWVRWAFAHQQTYRSWSTGTPGDEQLSSYLLECDHVVSADNQFVSLANGLRSEAPFALPEAHLIAAGSTGVEQLFKLMSD